MSHFIETIANDNRNRLLRAAVEIFMEEGYGASMDRIASRAGMAGPTAAVLPAAGAPLPQHRTLRESEDEAFLQALAAHQGSKAALAAKLGISERSLYRRLKALQPPAATP